MHFALHAAHNAIKTQYKKYKTQYQIRRIFFEENRCKNSPESLSFVWKNERDFCMQKIEICNRICDL